MSIPKVFYENILNEPTNTFSISSGTDIQDRINDYRKNNQWEADSTAAQQIISDSGVAVPLDSLILDNHNLDGRDLNLKGSSDNFVSSDVSLVSWSQPGNGNILKQLSLSSFRYHKLSIGSGAENAKIGEMYIGVGIVFPKNPSIPHDPDQEKDFTEVYRNDHGFRRTVARFKRKIFELTFRMMIESQYAIFITFWQAVRCFKPFYYCFRPTTAPEGITLVRNTTKLFTAPLSGKVRTALKMIFEEVF